MKNIHKITKLEFQIGICILIKKEENNWNNICRHSFGIHSEEQPLILSFSFFKIVKFFDNKTKFQADFIYLVDISWHFLYNSTKKYCITVLLPGNGKKSFALKTEKLEMNRFYAGVDNFVSKFSQRISISKILLKN